MIKARVPTDRSDAGVSDLKRYVGLALAVCAGLFPNLAHAVPRTSEPINRDWSFTRGNPAGAQAAGHDTRPGATSANAPRTCCGVCSTARSMALRRSWRW